MPFAWLDLVRLFARGREVHGFCAVVADDAEGAFNRDEGLAVAVVAVQWDSCGHGNSEYDGMGR